MTAQAEAIKDSLEPLFRSAEANGLWFHCAYQDLWFSPTDLREQQARGYFVWGATNWTLRHPRELIESAQADVVRATQRLATVQAMVHGTARR